MQRDLELIRKMLLKIEEGPHARPDDWTVDGYSEEMIGYHAYLLVKGGFAEGDPISSEGMDSPMAQIFCLTWQGHEFAAAARDDSTWSRAMGMVKEKGGNITVGVLTQLLTHIAKSAFGICS